MTLNLNPQIRPSRALSGSPFTLLNTNFDPDRNGIQGELLPAGDYSGTGADPYSLKNYKAERNGARGRDTVTPRRRVRASRTQPLFLSVTASLWWPFPPRAP